MERVRVFALVKKHKMLVMISYLIAYYSINILLGLIRSNEQGDYEDGIYILSYLHCFVCQII